MFVIEKLRENIEFLSKKLVGEIDGSVHDSCSMGSYGISNMADVDSVQMFVI